MRSFIRLVALLTPALAAAAPHPQLVKTNQRQELFVIPYGWELLGTTGCSVTSFTPEARSIVAANGSAEPAHTSDPLTVPACAYPLGFGEFKPFVGDFNPRSLHDVGTYTVTCLNMRLFGRDSANCLSTACGPVCINAYPVSETPSFTTTIQVFNNAPRAGAISMLGSGIVDAASRKLRHDANVDFSLSASDADGSVRVSWRAVGPAGATASIFGSGPNANMSFNGQANFGTWTVFADVDDDQGERVTSSLTFTVENQPFTVMLSGSTRVTVNQPIRITATGDDDGGDYATVRWSARRPGSSSYDPLPFTGLALERPTTAMDLGMWSFRIEVTDNDTFPAAQSSWAQVEVEVVNELPAVTVSSPPTLVRVGNTLTLTATAMDPDGGKLRSLTWRAVQAPNSAGVAVGTAITTGGTLTRAMGGSSAGTWVFRATAEDDEGGRGESMPVTVVVDANPIGAVRGAPTVVGGPGPFSIVDESRDPDSYCADPMDARRCHSVEPGAPFTPLSAGITEWRWFFQSVPSSWRLRFPVGSRVRARFPTSEGAAGVLTFFQDGSEYRTLPPGDWAFRSEVVDAEGNTTSSVINVRVLAPLLPPFALTTAPRRFLANMSRTLLEEVFVDGSPSFDPDELASATPTPGIVSWNWTALAPPGCTAVPSLPATARSRLFAAGTVLPAACFGAWTVRLIVVDNDGQAGVKDTTVLIGNCAGGTVCIDKPTQMAPYTITTASTVNVPIYFYVDASIYAAHPGGFYALIDILPAGSSTPTMTLTDISASSHPGALTSVSWRGETTAGGTATSGTYDVRVRIKSLAWADVAQATERFAISFENATVNVTPPNRYVRHQDLADGRATADFSYSISGAISVNQVRSTISRAGAVVWEQTASSTALSGTLAWDGRTTSGTLAPAAEYELQVSAFRGSTLLKRSTPLKFWVYRLQVGPVTPARPLISVRPNTNDDNRNGVRDMDETSVAAEGDLMPVTVTVTPATLIGSLSLRPATPTTGFALFNGPTKVTAHPSPLTVARPGTAIPPLWVEGRVPGRYELELGFTANGGVVLTPERVTVSVYGIQVVRDVAPLVHELTDPEALGLRPGSWVDGHVPAPAFDPLDPTPWATVEVLNDASSNFVDNDPEHFFVRVYDAEADRDSAVRETLAGRIGTLTEWPAIGAEEPADPLHEVTLVETAPNSGIFVSQAQLLTSIDEWGGELDDLFQAVGPLGPVADEATNDRTHRIGAPGHGLLAGAVRAEYTRPSGGAALTTTPVCGRSPDERRIVNMKFATLLEPFLDDGIVMPGGAVMGAGNGRFDFINSSTATDLPDGTPVHDTFEVSEPYWDFTTGEEMPFPGGTDSELLGRGGRGWAIDEARVDRELRAANAAWAPTCIEFRRSGPLVQYEAPVLDSAGHDVLDDGILDLTALEHWSIKDALHSRLGFGPIVGDNVFAVYGPADLFAFRDDGTGHLEAVTALAATWGPGNSPASLLGSAFIVLRGNLSLVHSRILGHELGHALANTDDSPNPAWQMYPASFTAPGIGYLYRRTPLLTRQQMVTDRPAGDPAAPGNLYRRPYVPPAPPVSP